LSRTILLNGVSQLAFSTLMVKNELHSAETTWQDDSSSAGQ